MVPIAVPLQMSLFCLATSVALLIDYIVTYTILAPVVYLCSDKKDYQPALPSKPSGNDYLGKVRNLRIRYFSGYNGLAIECCYKA